MPTLKASSAAAALAATAAFTALSSAPAGAADVRIPGCKPVNVVEAIIDDSGSMVDTDPNGLRVAGLQQFITSPLNTGKILGAVEFGTAPAVTVFPPTKIGKPSHGRLSSTQNTMIASLQTSVVGNNGGTEYDPAFQRAAQDNPRAQARIFLTDGAPTSEYLNSHRGGPKTYVVGLGIGPATPSDTSATRLQQIATETGGTYFPSVDQAKLQPTFNQISSAVGCYKPPRLFTSKPFTRPKQTTTGTTSIAAPTKNVDVAVNWTQPSNKFSIVGVSALGNKNKVLATLDGKGRPGKLKIKKTQGATFQTFSVTKPRGTKKIKFKVRAARVAQPESTNSQVIIH